jgi:DNA-binding transcriptional LysR family regulator
MNAETQCQLDAADLAVVLAVTRGGTLAKAGERLKVDASTVFRSMQRIEKALGQTLFERSRQGYQPTQLAMDLCHHAERVEAALEAARAEVQQRAGTATGTVRITTTDTILHGLLLPVLPALAVKHPKLQHELVATNEFVSLAKRDADIALRATTAPPPHLVGRPLQPLHFALYAPKRYRGRSLDDVIADGVDWIVVDDYVPEHASVRWRQKRLPKVVPRYQVNSISAVCEAIAAGLGVGIAPTFLCEHRKDMKRLGDIIPECDSQLWLLSHPESRHVRRVAVVVAHLAEQLAAPS